MLIINTEHYVRGLAAQGSTKIENGVGEQIVLLILQETTDRGSGILFREKKSPRGVRIKLDDGVEVLFELFRGEGRG